MFAHDPGASQDIVLHGTYVNDGEHILTFRDIFPMGTTMGTTMGMGAPSGQCCAVHDLAQGMEREMFDRGPRASGLKLHEIERMGGKDQGRADT